MSTATSIPIAPAVSSTVKKTWHILTNFYCVPKLSRGHVLRLRAQGKEHSRALRRAESRARQVTGHGTGHFRGKGTGQGTGQGTGHGTG